MYNYAFVWTSWQTFKWPHAKRVKPSQVGTSTFPYCILWHLPHNLWTEYRIIIQTTVCRIMQTPTDTSTCRYTACRTADTHKGATINSKWTLGAVDAFRCTCKITCWDRATQSVHVHIHVHVHMSRASWWSDDKIVRPPLTHLPLSFLLSLLPFLLLSPPSLPPSILLSLTYIHVALFLHQTTQSMPTCSAPVRIRSVRRQTLQEW